MAAPNPMLAGMDPAATMEIQGGDASWIEDVDLSHLEGMLPTLGGEIQNTEYRDPGAYQAHHPLPP